MGFNKKIISPNGPGACPRLRSTPSVPDGRPEGAERSPGIRSRTRPRDRGRVGEAGYVAGNSPFSSLR
jgi:hypothetical protein